MFVSSGSYNLVSNYYLGKDCDHLGDGEAPKKGVCVLDYITLFSSVNKRDDATGLNHLQEILNLVTIICIIFLFQYCRHSIR